MAEIDCWVAVDKDGTEKVSNTNMMRRRHKDGKSRVFSVMWGLCKGHYTKNNWNKWFTMASTEENDFLPFSGVILPNGTIEKIIGHKITWEDEPVKINFNNQITNKTDEQNNL